MDIFQEEYLFGKAPENAKNKPIKQEEEKHIQKIGQEEFHNFVFEDKFSWQELIYDLINTEQLDPWDINLSLLAQKYLEKIKELEEANFTLSSKVLLVCSLLLRLKSEILLNKQIKSIDDILFNKKQETQEKLKITDFDDDEIPELVPRTPLPRLKKISLEELMSALNKAIQTEERRTTKKTNEKEQYEKTKFFLPKKSINLLEKIKEMHGKVTGLFQKNEKIPFSQISGIKKEEKIEAFIPLLHLDNQKKLWLHQEKYLEEIWLHKNGDEFIKKQLADMAEMENDIITNNIENQFEAELEEMNIEEENKELI